MLKLFYMKKENPFKNSLDNKRYHTFNYFLRKKFASKVFKVPLDIGSSCPNIKSGGCIYCKNSSRSVITNKKLSLLKQYEEAAEILNKKWPNSKKIVYFQAGTNTNMCIKKFKKLVEPFLEYKDVVGISIATRSDSITAEYYKYFKDLNKKTFLTIELGLQSSNDKTLKLINRGHDVNNFINAVKRLKENNIFIVTHIINGLPYENKNDMINTVKLLNYLKIDGIKIHMLHVLKDTILSKIYEKEGFHILDKDEYIDIVINQLEYLDKDIVIERITGDPIKDELITPKWLLKKFVLLNDIDKEMLKRNTYQGKKVEENK